MCFWVITKHLGTGGRMLRPVRFGSGVEQFVILACGQNKITNRQWESQWIAQTLLRRVAERTDTYASGPYRRRRSFARRKRNSKRARRKRSRTAQVRRSLAVVFSSARWTVPTSRLLSRFICRTIAPATAHRPSSPSLDRTIQRRTGQHDPARRLCYERPGRTRKDALCAN